MHAKKTFVKMILGIVLLMNGGCAAVLIGGGAVAGAGTMGFIKGELQSTIEASLDQSWTASQNAMNELNFAILEIKKEALNANVTATGPDDKKIKIILKSETPSVTRIGIRVGVFGDEELSRLILEKIKQLL